MQTTTQLKWILIFSLTQTNAGISLNCSSVPVELQEHKGMSSRAIGLFSALYTMGNAWSTSHFLKNLTLLSSIMPMNAHFLVGGLLVLVAGICICSLFRKATNSPMTHAYNSFALSVLTIAYVYGAIRGDMLVMRIAEAAFFFVSAVYVIFVSNKNRISAWGLVTAGILAYAKYVLAINGIYIAYLVIALVMFAFYMFVDKLDDEK